MRHEFKMTQIIFISFLYSGPFLLLLGIPDISHVDGQTTPATAITHNTTVPYVSTANISKGHKETTAILKSETIHLTDTTDTSTVKHGNEISKESSTKDPPVTTDHHLSTSKHGNEDPKYPRNNVHSTDTPDSSTVKHENEISNESSTKDPAGKQRNTMTTVGKKDNGNHSMNATGIIIGCFLGLIFIFVIFAVIIIRRKKKLKSYSFELQNKSPENMPLDIANA